VFTPDASGPAEKILAYTPGNELVLEAYESYWRFLAQTG
jgi:hypothetical protein